MSAPARMNPRWSERTLSGARMFASSGQRSRGTALETSAPMPPSPTSGGPYARRSRKRLTASFQHARLDGSQRPSLRSQATRSTPLGGAVKRSRVTPAVGESTTVRSLTTGGDAAAARVRSARGEGAVPPTEELAGDGASGGLAATPLRLPFAIVEETSQVSDSRPARCVVPIATATPGWGLTAISQAWSFEKGRRTTPPFSLRKSGIR